MTRRRDPRRVVYGWGWTDRQGDLRRGVFYRRVDAIRAACWAGPVLPEYRRANDDERRRLLRPIDSGDRLTAYERRAWRWQYRRGARIVRVVQRVYGDGR